VENGHVKQLHKPLLPTYLLTYLVEPLICSRDSKYGAVYEFDKSRLKELRKHYRGELHLPVQAYVTCTGLLTCTLYRPTYLFVSWTTKEDITNWKRLLETFVNMFERNAGRNYHEIVR